MTKKWEKNRSILKSIPNPSKDAYEIKMKVPELTFEGVRVSQISLSSTLRFTQAAKS